MPTRRLALLGIAASAVTATAARAQAVLSDDGLHTQPWFLQSFLELAEDVDNAAEKGKRFVVMWELRGCPACRNTHLINFARPDIASYVQERFDLLQLNIIGAREVTDFDGEKLTEKRMAEKYGVRSTPTFQFFAERAAGLGALQPREREVARAQGYLEPSAFQAMFRFVSDRAYEKGSLADYLKASG